MLAKYYARYIISYTIIIMYLFVLIFKTLKLIYEKNQI